MTIHNFAFYFSLSIIIGIFSKIILDLPLFILVPLIFIITAFSLFLALSRHSNFIFTLSILTLLIIPSFIYADYRFTDSTVIFPNLNQLVTVSAQLNRSPEVYTNYQRLKVQLTPPAGESYQGEVFIYTDLYDQYRYGDTLEIKGVISKSPNGLIMMSWPSITITGWQGGFIRTTLFNFKNSILQQFASVLPPTESALLSGLTLGERGGFTKEFKESMSKSGTTHLVALSGYNITIIAYAITLLLTSFFSRRTTFWLTILSIILFVIMVGAEPSIVRAAVMGIIGLLAIQVGRLYSVRNAITISATAMLIITPSAIADIGFQLSFMALLGLVYLLPAIRQFFNISQSLSLLGWRENLLTTASAQLMVLPLILFYFSYFSPFSLIANVLILESVPYTMLLGLFIALFSWLGPAGSIITDLISYPAHFLLAYQIKVINIFAQFNLFSFTTNSLKIYLIIFFYLLIFFFIKNTLYPKTHSLS